MNVFNVFLLDIDSCQDSWQMQIKNCQKLSINNEITQLS